MGRTRIALFLFIAILDLVCTVPRISAEEKQSDVGTDEGTQKNLSQNEQYENRQAQDSDDDSQQESQAVDPAYVQQDDEENQDDEVNQDKVKNQGDVTNRDDEENNKNEVKPAEDPDRPLSAGDIFTPPEFLPIAKKLIAKVEEPGQGKGIVSSAKNAEELADKLFQAFFLTQSRIVTLKDYDIVGLDALQALSIAGDVADLRMHKVQSKPKLAIVKMNGQQVAVNTEPKKSKYKLLKKSNKTQVKKRFVLRRRDGATNNLKKSKHNPSKPDRRRYKTLINVKYEEKGLKQSKRKSPRHEKDEGKALRSFIKKTGGKEFFSYTKTTKPSNQTKLRPMPVVFTTAKHSICHWRYECEKPGDLDTCKVKTVCRKSMRKSARKASSIENIGIYHRPDEHSTDIQNFRRMIGISLVDEEVEKIIETRVLRVKPESQLKNRERLESLAEYFNNIIMAEHFKTTRRRSMTTGDEAYHMDQEKLKEYGSHESGPGSHETHVAPDQEFHQETSSTGRRMLGIPTTPMTTPQKFKNKYT